MNLDKYTKKAQEAVFTAQKLASDFNHQTIEPAHLLLALLQQQSRMFADSRNLADGPATFAARCTLLLGAVRAAWPKSVQHD